MLRFLEKIAGYVNKRSLLSLVACIVCLWMVINTTFYRKQWENGKVIDWDVISYYAYLPAAFIHHDLTLSFTNENPGFYAGNHEFWPVSSPNGHYVIKTTMGMAILYSPFFWIGDKVAKFNNLPHDGFSKPYHEWIQLSGIFYFLIALWFLRKLLLLFFSDLVTAVTILSVVLGTNLYFYLTENAAMSHGYSFMLIIVFLYYSIAWHKKPLWKYAVLLGLLGGLISLIRPVNIMVFLFPLLYQVDSVSSFKSKILFFISHYRQLLVVAVLVFLVWVPQMIYWKYITGHFLFNSYIGENLFILKPRLLEVLFSYRKGWLVYSPVMLFSLVGFIYLYKTRTALFLSVFPLMIIFIYIISSWWCWWYGGSYGMRPMVDIYGLLTIPFAAFVEVVFKRKRIILAFLSSCIFYFCIWMNFVQMEQYHVGFLHYDSMTKKAYWTIFLRKRMTRPEITSMEKTLKTPDNKKALKGESEYDFRPF